MTAAPCLIPFAGLSRPAEGKALRSRGNHPKVRKDPQGTVPTPAEQPAVQARASIDGRRVEGRRAPQQPSARRRFSGVMSTFWRSPTVPSQIPEKPKPVAQTKSAANVTPIRSATDAHGSRRGPSAARSLAPALRRRAAGCAHRVSPGRTPDAPRRRSARRHFGASHRRTARRAGGPSLSVPGTRIDTARLLRARYRLSGRPRRQLGAARRAANSRRLSSYDQAQALRRIVEHLGHRVACTPSSAPLTAAWWRCASRKRYRGAHRPHRGAERGRQIVRCCRPRGAACSGKSCARPSRAATARRA